MNFAQVLSAYLMLNAMMAVAWGGLRLAAFIWSWQGTVPGPRSELRLHYFILVTLFGVTLIHPVLPRRSIFSPVVKVWSASSIDNFIRDYSPEGGGYLALPAAAGASGFEADRAMQGLLLLGLVALGIGVCRLARDLRALHRIRRRSYLVRKLGSVEIFANDEIQVPFSYRTWGCSAVVVPTGIMASPEDLRVAVAHEIQHHRQGDTVWVYPLWLLRTLCAWNPVAHLWNISISELQEFACDAALVDQCKVESRQYARCLVEVAQSALAHNRVPACATGFALLGGRNILKRRVEKMLSISTAKHSRWTGRAAGGLVAGLIAATALVSHAVVQDRRVTMAEALRLASQGRSGSEFPVVVNDLVLKQLNRYIGTPEGREFMRNALQRMENHRALVEGKIKQYQVPPELAAVPIVESGYRNLEQSSHAGWGAGVWMFIVSTARNFGLRVDDQVDERLNLELETDAAMRYLKSENLRFNDWLLAALSYNMGEKRVYEGIAKTGSRDAWALVRSGFEGDKDYLSRLTAAILIMRNPDSVR